VSGLRITGASNVYLFRVLDYALIRMLVFMLSWIDYVVEILPICRDLEILYDDVYMSYDMYILEMYVLYLLRLLKNFYMHVLRSIEDVTSIS